MFADRGQIHRAGHGVMARPAYPTPHRGSHKGVPLRLHGGHKGGDSSLRSE